MLKVILNNIVFDHNIIVECNQGTLCTLYHICFSKWKNIATKYMGRGLLLSFNLKYCPCVLGCFFNLLIINVEWRDRTDSGYSGWEFGCAQSTVGLQRYWRNFQNSFVSENFGLSFNLKFSPCFLACFYFNLLMINVAWSCTNFRLYTECVFGCGQSTVGLQKNWR